MKKVTDDPNFHIVLTGANGFIGSCVLDALLKDNFAVTILSSSGLTRNGVERVFKWQLGDEPPAEAFKSKNGAETILVHFAHQWVEGNHPDNDQNVSGSKVLFEAATKHGCSRIIFASSVSARRDALNQYGRSKAQVEEKLASERDFSLRIGVVCSDQERGQWGTLCNLTRRLGFFVLPGADNLVQPIRIEDIAQSVISAIRLPPSNSIILAVCGAPVPFGQFLKILKAARYGGRFRIIAFPNFLLRLVITFFETLPEKVRPNTERLRGLLGIPTIPWEDDLKRLGVQSMSVSKMVALRARPYRGAVREGATVLAYVMGKPAPKMLIRRYARALLENDDVEVLGFGKLSQRFPWLLIFQEPLKSDGEMENLRTRVAFGSSLVGTLPNDRQTTNGEPRSRFQLFGRLAKLGLVQCFSLPVRAISGRRTL